MRMKYTAFSILCITALATLLVIYSAENKLIQNDVPDTSVTQTTQPEYILKSENNKISLYQDGNFIKSYDISPVSLPLTDQDNLRSGIKLKTYSDVISIIEDFSS